MNDPAAFFLRPNVCNFFFLLIPWDTDKDNSRNSRILLFYLNSGKKRILQSRILLVYLFTKLEKKKKRILQRAESFALNFSDTFNQLSDLNIFLFYILKSNRNFVMQSIKNLIRNFF